MAVELRWLKLPAEDDSASFAALLTRFRQDVIPEERAVDVNELHAQLVQAPRHRKCHALLALRDGHPAGAAQIIFDEMQGQRARVPFLYVAPEHRGRGIGSRLLDVVRDRAGAEGRVRLGATTAVGDETGRRFAEASGGRAGLVNEQSRCPTTVLDVRLLRGWVDRAGERARGYSLVAFDGVCPAEHLDAFTTAIPIMNTAPRSEGTEDVLPSPDEVRENMSAHVSQGNEPWTVCARDERTGRFAGYTELSFPKRRPWHSTQGDTGVHPDHRKRGIGSWLKAHTALRLLSERPHVEYIETWNAATNDAMHSINRAMGFTRVAAWQDWDVSA